jgi:hypothetical protein
MSNNPFPMPEPQRTAAVLIIVEVAKRRSLPPGYLTTHIDSRPDVAEAREEAQRRILVEVPGMDHSMLARAWGRDVRRIRALVHGPKKLNRSRVRGGLQAKRGGKFK